MPRETEAAVWRIVASVLGLLLVVCVIVNAVTDNAVPHEITLLLLGCLVAVGVGYGIVHPNISQAILSAHDEVKFRRKQYAVSFVFSAVLALLLLRRELRETALPWLFAPIIALPFGLLIRHRITGD